MRKIALTGGGTAGHVNPNIALIPALQKKGYEIIYIGSRDGIERTIISRANIKYIPINTGKLRRYLSVKNITDTARVAAGINEARKALKSEKVDIVFSKGGFVGVPVVLGAAFNAIPVVAHESDYSPGLANRIALPFAKKVCVTFPETLIQIGKKAVLTGNPVRAELFGGKKDVGLDICGFKNDRPLMLVMGGSLGSKRINECVRSILRTLTERYNIAHICGKGNVSEELAGTFGYCQFEYIDEELPHIFAAADFVVSRAGANAISELFALKKPNLLIPLPKSVSRGDQILNAASFKKQGYSAVLEEEQLSEIEMLKQISALYEKRDDYITAMSRAPICDAVSEICGVIADVLGG